MNIVDYNREAWDAEVSRGNIWTKPVDSRTVANARRGEWSILLTPAKPVPGAWFPEPMHGVRVLCLASGGGQQGPIFAAAGATVTVFDNSEKQLESDRMVARRENLEIRTVQGDMRDLSDLAEESFDLIVHPVSNCFVPEIRPVWREAYRVLAAGGILLSGFIKPFIYMFDQEEYDKGNLEVRHPIPYSAPDHLPRRLLEQYLAEKEPLEFSHTLEEQIQGQINAGFVITGMYEDTAGGEELMDKYMPIFIATRALKPEAPLADKKPDYIDELEWV
jgi:SAM-dependent methyltransferase